MLKKRLRVFLLCILFAVCLQGGCSAEDEKENWMQFHYMDDWDIFYVDTNSIKAREYEGRKYLDVKIRRREKQVEQLILVNRWIEVKNAEWHTLYDLQNGNSVSLEWWDKYHNPDKGTSDISEIKTAPEPPNEIGDQLIGWVNQHYPVVLNEIRDYNQQYAAKHPQANVPTGTVAGGAANGDYGFVQTLGDGPVQYVPRSLHRAPTHPVPSDSIVRYYVSGVPANGIITRFDYKVPPIAPFSSKPLYILYTSRVYHSLISNTIIAIFSYDDATNTFTLYPESLSSMEYDVSRPLRKIHIIDKDTVEGIYWDDETYSEDNPLTLQFKYIKALPGYNADMDGCAWTGWDLENDIHAPIDVYFVGNFGASNLNLDYGLVYWDAEDELGLDGLFAFLAHKGKVGYAPAGPNVEYWAKVPH